MIAYTLLRLKGRPVAILTVLLFVVTTLIVISCGGGNTSMQSPNMGTVNVSISDPPSCLAPAGVTNMAPGTFSNVWITIVSIKAHTSATADGSSAGWQELAPQLSSAPAQVDLLHLPANGQCLLEQLAHGFRRRQTDEGSIDSI